jgi:hypothetical protein
VKTAKAIVGRIIVAIALDDEPYSMMRRARRAHGGEPVHAGRIHAA